MEHEFTSLCDLLDDELIRQETLLSLLQSQRKAVLERDTAFLDAKTAALRLVMAETVNAEKARHAVLRKIVDHLALPPEEQTLSNLIQHAPESQAKRLEECQQRMNAVMAESKALVQDNARTLRVSLRVVNRSLGVLSGVLGNDGAEYDDSGRGALRGRQGPTFIDQRG